MEFQNDGMQHGSNNGMFKGWNVESKNNGTRKNNHPMMSWIENIVDDDDDTGYNHISSVNHPIGIAAGVLINNSSINALDIQPPQNMFRR